MLGVLELIRGTDSWMMLLLLTSKFIIACVHMHMLMCWSMHVEVRGQLGDSAPLRTWFSHSTMDPGDLTPGVRLV